MKKFTVIFIIAIVAMCAVFADDSNIKVTTTVTENAPSFQIKATSTTLGTINADKDEVTVGADALLSANLTVTFEINQKTQARIHKTYTLTIAASDLQMSKGAPDTQKFAVVAAAPSITAKSVSNVTLDASTAGELEAAYDGKRIDAGTTLGTFSCTWNQNGDAEVGSYEATITLTVTAS